jgi:hypothetical protein
MSKHFALVISVKIPFDKIGDFAKVDGIAREALSAIKEVDGVHAEMTSDVKSERKLGAAKVGRKPKAVAAAA